MNEKFFHLPNWAVQRVVRNWPLRDIETLHGPDHWMRVSRNAQFLLPHVASRDNVAPLLPYVKLFALFHDSCRDTDGPCCEHGKWAAQSVMENWWPYLNDASPLGVAGTSMLCYAMSVHTGHQVERHVGPNDQIIDQFVAVCLDADRLDLGRVGIRPRPSLMISEMGAHIADLGTLEQLENFEP